MAFRVGDWVIKDLGTCQKAVGTPPGYLAVSAVSASAKRRASNADSLPETTRGAATVDADETGAEGVGVGAASTGAGAGEADAIGAGASKLANAATSPASSHSTSKG